MTFLSDPTQKTKIIVQFIFAGISVFFGIFNCTCHPNTRIWKCNIEDASETLLSTAVILALIGLTIDSSAYSNFCYVLAGLTGFCGALPYIS